MSIVEAIFRIKRGLSSDWTALDPVLDPGEPGLETDTGKVKYGDGSTAWTALDYTNGGMDIADKTKLDRWHTGTGSPETVVTAPVGSLYTRSDGGAGTTLYVKESGAGNTGWVAK